MKRIVAIMLITIMIIGIGGCSSITGLSSTEIQAKQKIISIATVQPENHPISIALETFKLYIEENIGDKYKVNIYYNGVMGGNSQAIELLQMGSLDLVATSGSNLESFNDVYKIFGMPYLFENEEHFRRCMNDKEFTEMVYESTKTKGIQAVTWFANGVNNIYSSKPIYTPDDLKGIKFRIQPSEANVKMAQGFGASAVVMAYGEVYTALQNRVIDAATNPEMALVSAKHGEVAKYYSRTEHQIFTDLLVANVDFLKSLVSEDKTVFEEAFNICNNVAVEEWDKQIVECIEQALEMGVEFITVDKEPFEQAQESVREDLLGSYPVLQPLYSRVQELKEVE